MNDQESYGKERERKENERKRIQSERKNRLLAMSESESYSLSSEDRYDRIRYVREREGMDRYEENRRRTPAVEPKKEKPIINPPKRDWSKQYD